MNLWNKIFKTDLPDTFQQPIIVKPDDNIITIARLFLEKLSDLKDNERETIKCHYTYIKPVYREKFFMTDDNTFLDYELKDRDECDYDNRKLPALICRLLMATGENPISLSTIREAFIRHPEYFKLRKPHA